MKAHEMVAKARNLPPISQAALRLVSLLDKPQTSNEEVVEVLRTDTVLTAKLLRACNSPVFGFQDPVTSVDQAVLILGHREVLQMVLRLAFGTVMSVTLPGYAIEANELWSHALMSACAGQAIVNRGLGIDAEPALGFTVGLLHDIGKLVMGPLLSREQQTAIRQKIASGHSSAEAERAVLGTDHAEVGACLLFIWRLPEAIVEAVANHHSPAMMPSPKLSVVAHAANCIAHLAAAAPGWEGYACKIDPGLAQLLQLDENTLDLLVINVRESYDRSSKQSNVLP
jgi:putative nucleotidyltransferase with HDIG domain